MSRDVALPVPDTRHLVAYAGLLGTVVAVCLKGLFHKPTPASTPVVGGPGDTNMTFHDAVKLFIEGAIQAEVTRLLPAAAHLIPGATGEVVASALALPEVQAAIAKAEIQGADALVDLLFHGWDELKKLIEGHVHGKVKTVVDKVLNAPTPEIHLSADEVKALAQFAAAGRWSELRKALGLP